MLKDFLYFSHFVYPQAQEDSEEEEEEDQEEDSEGTKTFKTSDSYQRNGFYERIHNIIPGKIHMASEG